MVDVATYGLAVDPSGVVAGTRVATTSLNKLALQTEGAAARMDRSFKKATTSALSMGKIFAGLTLGVVFLSFAKKAKEFESAISELSAITGATGKDLDRLSDSARRMGEATTLSASQAAEAFKLVASAKPDLLENAAALEAVTQSAVTLAEASGTDLPIAAETLGAALNQFSADAAEAAKFIDILAAGAKFGASEIPHTAAALEKAGVVASQAGISFAETNAAIQALAKGALKGQLAGTGLRGVFLKLTAQTNDSFNPAVVGMVQALKNLDDANLSSAEKTRLFGQESITAAELLFKEVDNLDEFIKKLEESGVAADQARTRFDNLQGDLLRLGSAFEEFILALTETDSMRDAVQSITEGVKSLTENIDKLVIAGKAFAALLLGRLISGLTAYTTGIIANTASKRANLIATLNSAKASAAARATRAALTQVILAEAKAYSIATVGTSRHAAALAAVTAAEIRATAATNAHAIAIARTTVAATAASGAMGVLRGVMALLGGPVGLLVTAAAGLALWYSSAKNAKEETKAFAAEVDNLNKKITALDLSKGIEEAKRKVAFYRKGVDTLTESLKKQRELGLKADDKSVVATVFALQNANKQLSAQEKLLAGLIIQRKELASIAAGEAGKATDKDIKRFSGVIRENRKALYTDLQKLEIEYNRTKGKLEEVRDRGTIEQAKTARALLLEIQENYNDDREALLYGAVDEAVIAEQQKNAVLSFTRSKYTKLEALQVGHNAKMIVLQNAQFSDNQAVAEAAAAALVQLEIDTQNSIDKIKTGETDAERLTRERKEALSLTRSFYTDLEKENIDYWAKKIKLEDLSFSESADIRETALSAAEKLEKDHQQNLVDIKNKASGLTDVAESLGLTFTSAFEDAIVEGRNLQDVLKGLEKDLLRLITRQLVTKPLAASITSGVTSLFSSGGGTGGGGGGFDFGSFFGGFLAHGGGASAGKPYIVGEEGPELFVPRTSGTVVPNDRINSTEKQQVNVTNHFNIRSDNGRVSRESQTQIAAKAGASIRRASARNN